MAARPVTMRKRPTGTEVIQKQVDHESRLKEQKLNAQPRTNIQVEKKSVQIGNATKA